MIDVDYEVELMSEQLDDAAQIACARTVSVGAPERTWIGALRPGDRLTLLWMYWGSSWRLPGTAVSCELRVRAHRPAGPRRAPELLGEWIVTNDTTPPDDAMISPA